MQVWDYKFLEVRNTDIFFINSDCTRPPAPEARNVNNRRWNSRRERNRRTAHPLSLRPEGAGLTTS